VLLSKGLLCHCFPYSLYFSSRYDRKEERKEERKRWASKPKSYTESEFIEWLINESSLSREKEKKTRTEKRAERHKHL